MRVLGLSAFYHDSAAALVEDGRIVAAAQEERFTRKKHDAGFPAHAARYCLEAAGTRLDEVDHVVFYDKPFLKFERLLETYLAFAPNGFQSFAAAMPVWLREKLFQKDLLMRELKALDSDIDWRTRLLFTEHHQSHAASAFYPSPFEEAVVLTMDGVGEWATTSAGVGRGRELVMIKELHFPHSLGLLYSAFTYYTGFKVNSGEYKVMGLAPYGEPTYRDRILEELVDLKPDGSFRLNLDYFDYCTGLTMTNGRFDELFGGPPRRADQRLEPRHMDLAASIQAVTEEVVLRLTRALAEETGLRNLCLAGGVALNCVANGKVLRDGRFDGLWIQPAAGDAGGALGAALTAYHLYKGGERLPRSNRGDAMSGAYLGPSFEQGEIERRLGAAGARFEVVPEEEALLERTAQTLADGKAVGWFQGRMEFGPDWFELDGDSPYMLLVADVRRERCREMSADERSLFGIDRLNVPRSEIPAVTHVDYSARIQTVHAETNPCYHALLRRFKDITGCPVLVNTSFNVRGEPIVCTPEDAFRCFMGTEIEVLVAGDCYLEKGQQNPSLKLDYKNAFELD
jgi:carbamoyltransferase